MPSGSPFWTDAIIESQLCEIAGSLGFFPSAAELRASGRNDLVCAVTKRGGLIAWAARLGFERRPSDSDTGWEGEREVGAMFHRNGLTCVPAGAVKAPFDLLVGEVLRVDVKSARFAEYSSKTQRCRGWFYRIGKIPQADVVLLYQLDTGTFYGVPWWDAGKTNINIHTGGHGRFEKYLNNWPLLRQMIGLRAAERARIGGTKVLEVA